jgi:hypothetical protein
MNTHQGNDLKARLMNWYATYFAETGPTDRLVFEFLTDVKEAVHTIARLEAENTRLRNALEKHE